MNPIYLKKLFPLYSYQSSHLETLQILNSIIKVIYIKTKTIHTYTSQSRFISIFAGTYSHYLAFKRKKKELLKLQF